MGTAGTGHTFPGACVPFGMVQLSPDTRTQGWAACAGYQANDARILGFSHNHLSGTGCGDLGTILLMPAVGAVELGPRQGESGFPQTFDHESETMLPGYYRVRFPDAKTTVELTATTRAGLHRYTFPASEEAHVCFDLHHGIGGNVRQCALNVESDRVISGYRKYVGWGRVDMQFFFVAEFSKPFGKVIAVVDNKKPAEGKQFKGRSIRARRISLPQTRRKCSSKSAFPR